MAFEEIKGKGAGGMDVGMEGDRGLVAGRSQREKRRSYKDLLREEEEMAAEVRKSSKKRPKDSELFLLGGADSHKKKKKHGDEYYYREHDGSAPPPHKKKRKSADRSPPLANPSAGAGGSSHPTDTAMGLLQAITSPMATGSDPSPHMHKKPSYPTFSSHSSKDRKREGSGNKGGHSLPHSRPAPSSSSKKHSSSKSSLFHGGAQKEEPLTLREADGLKMKLIMSPEKEEAESYPPFAPSHAPSKGGARKEKGDRGRDGGPPAKTPKKKVQQSREPLPVVGKEVEVEGHYGGGMGDDSSSSGGELEAGELVIDDSYTHLSKKKKKSKKSKKKKDKEKGGREKKHSKGSGGSHPDAPRAHTVAHGHGHGHQTYSHSHVGPMYAMGGRGGANLPHHPQGNDTVTEKKKKKEEKHEKDKDKPSWSHPDASSGRSRPTYSNLDVGPMYAMGTPAAQQVLQGKGTVTEKKKKKEEKHEKDKPKKVKRTAPTTAYQVFCKEYRVNINQEQPGSGQGLKAGPNKQMFGELSKKLAEVWKNMPEKDKLVWRQKAQYLQHKQNKAEATTVKRKPSTDGKSKGSIKGVGITTGLVSPPRASTGVSLSPARVPDVDPIDAAAHLQLLGESLSLIGHRLQETEGMVAVSGSLSVLLDSILCALGPLTCLTAQIPQLNGCPRTVLSNTLDNIAYIMPGL